MPDGLVDFKDKTVVITGGATGIGFALAKVFAARGARLCLAEPREEKLQESVAALVELGCDAKYFVCDVTDLSQVEALADFAWEQNGQVDVLINNAGVSMANKPLVDTAMDELHAVFDVNFFGVWHGCRVFAQRFEEQGTPAAIYNTGSENSFFCAVPNHAAYIASKHAVLGLTDSLREQVPDFIHVGLIIPGFVKSDMTARMADLAMDTDEFAATVVKQIEDGQFFIVSHAYNMVRIQERYEELAAAYASYAPRHEGDEVYDVRVLMAAASEEASHDA